ncbi:ATP-binding protein [Streptomyces sp. NPDC048419]|uniref:ATP-binding protein n=1 Tax=Streptomyces sp. NPDC048419 TaxID=3365547 RepID=UPI00371ACD3B
MVCEAFRARQTIYCKLAQSSWGLNAQRPTVDPEPSATEALAPRYSRQGNAPCPPMRAAHRIGQSICHSALSVLQSGGQPDRAAHKRPGGHTVIHHPTTADSGVTWGTLSTPPEGLPHKPFPVGALLRYEQRLSASWHLPGRSLHTPRAARRHVTSTCRTWHVPRQITDSLALIVSELTTNAVVHARGDTIAVVLLLSPHHVWLSVTDEGRSRAPVTPRTTTGDAEDGRGLHLVEALASHWRTSTGPSGTRVWACMALPARPPTQAGSAHAATDEPQLHHPADPPHPPHHQLPGHPPRPNR